jgi:hypothetical protein
MTGLNMSIKTVTGLLIGIALLLFVLGTFGNAIMNMIFPDVSQLTEESLNTLEEIIMDMEDGEKIEDYLFYINDGYQLVAFNKSANGKSGNANLYERPTTCFNKACLVICKDNDNINACKNSNFISSFGEFNGFDETNPSSGIVTKVQGKYISLDLEMNELILSIKEVDEK